MKFLNSRQWRSVIIAWILALLWGCPANAEPSNILKLAETIRLEGVNGRIDHMAVNIRNGRLYVAALGEDTVEVIDTKAGKKVGQIAGLKKPQGVAVVPDLDRVVVASGDDGKVRVYDEGQKLLGTIDGLDDADNVRYHTGTKLLYVGYGDGALAVIDPQKVLKVADIKVGGHPESFQLEAKGNRIFVNVPDAREVAVIDSQKRAVVATWKLAEAAANFPMALDETNHRLFIGCRSPARLLVLDTETGKTVAGLECAGDTDDVFYDPAGGLIYVTGGEGLVSVFRQSGPDGYKLIGNVPTAKGARTSSFAAESKTLYVAVPHRGIQQAEIRVFKTALHE
jgi:YVTN family beta-propeller protein